jgi:HNH endonuclease
LKLNDCHFWTGARDAAGYGISWSKGKWIRAHRKVLIDKFGPISKGKVVCHLCDNKACVNPKHLWIGTPDDNSKDMVRKNRQAKGSKAGNSKLTEDTVLDIRDCFGNLSSRATAALYNISKTNVLDIWNRKIWKHI